MLRSASRALFRFQTNFSFLEYGVNLLLPDPLGSLLEEYVEAADAGKKDEKDCRDIYNG